MNDGACGPGRGETLGVLADTPVLFQSDPDFSYPGTTERVEADVLSPQIRVESFDEVEKGYEPFQAREEAGRCLRCYRMIMAAF